MTTLEHPYRETRITGGSRETVRIANKTVHGVENPLVGEALQQWQSRLGDTTDLPDWYVFAYFLEHHADDILDTVAEEIEEMSEEELKEIVIDIESKQADQRL